jgi:hypothetical protein
MNKKILLILLLVILSAVALVIMLKPNTKKSDRYSYKSNEVENLSMNNPNSPLGDQMSNWDLSTSPFKDVDPKPYLVLLEDLKSGKINFVWEVWALRRNCPADYTASQCDASIMAYIEKSYSSPDKEKLKELFKSYFQYENEMRQMEFPKDISFEEKYELIKKKRREMMGGEKSDLVFGMEESQVNFLKASKDFIDSSKSMNPEERVKKYEELRKKNYGSYYENVMKREDSYAHYQTEIDLREKELSGLSGEEKDKKLATLQVKYFGKEGAERIAKAKQEELAEQKKITDYENAEKEFLSANSSLSDKDKQAKLKDLRVKYLGAEDAEAYLRRKQYEEEASKIK